MCQIQQLERVFEEKIVLENACEISLEVQLGRERAERIEEGRDLNKTRGDSQVKSHV